ncbi:hypothetical protein PPTG_20752 [Phytophthora nicotianae INRA-310]|uniref:Uncharacterized protein n=1 Tax=Phytophthora nicotianae (strain INRA-310) TaxID=761204 RepID=W2RFN3_PHYN3|nr:hypothetical protein PPTG_20752 [Phytophthora nicotianae INRA-310]ETN24051.1 hypothetical protein PPTG_20752 [Phytophthora nicotianae INRA-310]
MQGRFVADVVCHRAKKEGRASGVICILSAEGLGSRLVPCLRSVERKHFALHERPQQQACKDTAVQLKRKRTNHLAMEAFALLPTWKLQGCMYNWQLVLFQGELSP